VGERMHVPVLVEEVTSLLARRESGLWVDATVGDGGHAQALLDATAPDGRLLGLDWDPSAIETARGRLNEYGSRVTLVCANYVDLDSHLPRSWPLKGVVLDAGLSSSQLDDAGRGFSFQLDGPLDMRMTPHVGASAAHLLKGLSAPELARLIAEYGEERRAGSLARAIVRDRRTRPITGSTQLADIIDHTHPARPAKTKARVFQALRVAVNKELENLQGFLAAAPSLLVPGSRMAIISYHSLEDRIVKQAFRQWASSCVCPPGSPQCTCGGTPRARLLTKRVIRPTGCEVSRNPRSRSARLRAIEWLADTA
jgi:16S rRNA (cytosine1402-N4)-methyltransferase